MLDEPVIQRSMIFELQRTDGMRHALNGVLLPVRKVIGGVNWPLITRLMMRRVPNAIKDGIAQIHIAGRHVDLGAQHPLSVGKLAAAHFYEQPAIFLNGSITIRTILTRLGQRPPVSARLLGRQIAHIRQTCVDEMERPFKELLKIR